MMIVLIKPVVVKIIINFMKAVNLEKIERHSYFRGKKILGTIITQRKLWIVKIKIILVV